MRKARRQNSELRQGDGSMSEVSNEIIRCERDRCHALLARDFSALSNLLSDRLVFFHANAQADDKSSLLTKMSSGSIIYQALEITEEKVIDLGNSAVLFSRLTAEVSVAGTIKHIDNRTSSVWAREENGWRLVAYQPTPIPKV